MLNNYSKLNILIEAYRKEKELTIKEHISYQGKFICDRHTYSKIKSKIELHDISIYDTFLEKMGYTMSNKPIIINTQKLWECLDYYKLVDLEIEMKNIEDQLSLFKKTDIIVAAYRKTLELIKKYFIKRESLSPSEIEYFVDIVDVFDVTMQKCIMLTIGYNAKRTKDYDIVDIIEFLNKYDEPSIELRVLKYYINNERHFDATKLSMKIEESLNKNNVIQTLDFYNSMSFLIKRTKSADNQYVKLYLEELNNKQNEIPQVKLIQYYGNLGIEYMLEKKYEEAIKYFSEIKDFDSRRRLATYIYLMFCYGQSHQEMPSYLYNLKMEREYTIDARNLYFYFNDKNKHTNKQNRSDLLYIIKQVSMNSTIYVEIIEKEMFDLCEDIGKYSDYHKVKKIIDDRKN